MGLFGLFSGAKSGPCLSQCLSNSSSEEQLLAGVSSLSLLPETSNEEPPRKFTRVLPHSALSFCPLPPSICMSFPGSFYCYSEQESHRSPEVPLCSLLSASSDAEISLENKKQKPLITFCFSCSATWLGAEIKAQHGGHGSPYSVSCSELLVKVARK